MKEESEMETTEVTYDFFDEQAYDTFEKMILGSGKFNELQKKFIYFNETSVIEAGPGSGKTTALGMKLALMIRKLERAGEKEGVCVITHTNAAVEEIRKVLKQVGIEQVQHPHFLGTIHQFFIQYGMTPYLKMKKYSRDYQFYTLTVEQLLRKMKKKYPWMSNSDERYQKNARKICDYLLKGTLAFNKYSELIHQGKNGSDKYSKYKKGYLEIRKQMFKQGYLDYNTPFVFSEAFLRKESNKQRIRERFKYVFMDEYQDVSKEADNLLRSLFETATNVIQYIGDQNQHINYDSQLIKTSGFAQLKQLNYTLRFGEEIADVLEDFGFGKMECAKPLKSTKPTILIYSSPERVPEMFRAVLEQTSQSKKTKDTPIMIHRKDYCEKLGVSLKPTISKKTATVPVESLEEILKVISKKIDSNVSSIRKELALEHAEAFNELKQSLRNFLRKTEESTEKLKDSMNRCIEKLGGNNFVNITNSIFDEIMEKTKKRGFVPSHNKEIIAKTIHDLKGQSIDSGLLYLEPDSVEERVFLKKHFKINNQSIEAVYERIVYVAMSRPKEGLFVALDKNTFENSVKKAELTNKWRILNEEDLLK